MYLYFKAISQKGFIFPMSPSKDWLSKMQRTNKLFKNLFEQNRKFMDGMQEKEQNSKHIYWLHVTVGKLTSLVFSEKTDETKID